MKVNLSAFLQWRLNIFLYLTFGWKIARFYVFFLGKLYFHLNKSEKIRISNAVLNALGDREDVSNLPGILGKVFDGILSHYYEKLFIAFEEPAKATSFLNKSIDTKDFAVLRRELSAGNGVIIVTGHYGAIEYIPTLLAVNGFRVSMIAKFETEQLKKKIYTQAKRYGIRLIDAKESGCTFRAAFQEMRQNRILVTQCDEMEEWRPSKKERMSFLGRMTGVDRTLNVMQKRTGARIIFGIIHRYNLRKYELIMYTLGDILKTLNNPSGGWSVSEILLKFLEEFIYAYPEQWYQWKKHPAIGGFGLHGSGRKRPEPPFGLETAFDTGP